jgi:tRNA guanosine-2'-O-methyltransferase
VSLEAFQFPEQCVLVLGNEQNGVPAHLLEIMDACLEIPMMGVTRSLNAHVSGAMAIWQATTQRRLAGRILQSPARKEA